MPAVNTRHNNLITRAGLLCALLPKHTQSLELTATRYHHIK